MAQESPPQAKKEPPKLTRSKVFRGIAVGLIFIAIVSNILLAVVPTDKKWQYNVDYPRSGKLYTYLYYYDEILGDPNKNLWLDDIASTYDYVYIIAPWGYYFTDNNTLDTKGLTNTTQMIRELGLRGCRSVIHTWYSSYHPKWLENYVPELINTSVRWKGMALDNPHYDILMNTNLQYIHLLCNYFANESVTDFIEGFCLDDETSSNNWVKVCRETTKKIHSINSSWSVTAMFNEEERYWMAGAMDYLAMDPYDDDLGVVAKMKYGHSLEVGKLSVLLSGMDNDTKTTGNKMRRQAWIAWFMGADSIGWWCYNIYWHGLRGGVANNWFVMPYNATGPSPGEKGLAVKGVRSDINLLKTLESQRLDAIKKGDTATADKIQEKMVAAYEFAKINDFEDAVKKLQEAN